MKETANNAFESIPRTAKGHFILNFYAAVYYILNHIRHLSDVGGDNLDKTFKKYPFLSGYLKEMHQYMPEKLAWERTSLWWSIRSEQIWKEAETVTWERASLWWEREITAWERSSHEHLPMLALTKQCGISFQSRIALMIVNLVEEDSRFGTLFDSMQEPLASRRPSFELISRIMDNDLTGDRWSVCRPLIEENLIYVENMNAPKSEWIFHMPPLLWEVVKGDVSSQPAPWLIYYSPDKFPEMNELICPSAFLKRLQQVPALVNGEKPQAIVLRGQQGSDLLQFMGAVARVMNRGAAVVDVTISLSEQHWQLLGPFCSLTGSIPVLRFDLGPGESADVPHLSCYRGPVGVVMGFEGGLRGPIVEKAVTLTLPAPDRADRMRYWQKALAEYRVENLAEICEKYHMAGGYISQAASMAVSYAALDKSEMLTDGHVREAFRTLNRQMLDTLAARLEVKGSWSQLIVSSSTTSKLRELERRCHNRERILEHLGPGFGYDRNRGVRALFTGESGTGKTLAAKILAAELGMDLYRVDLAAVINKYIGETEKNLHQVFSRAEELDVILLLDEGDALLGSRTDVKSANDRYANLETDYLLQRLENHQGIVLITTNTEGNIDTAFKRRMDAVVNFVTPQAQERWHIWQLHLPDDHSIDNAFLEDVSVRCVMTGGQIRNAALHAALLAIDEGNVVSRLHLEDAIRSEYRKSGGICPLNSQEREEHADIEAFLGALSL
jgi:hypothetical protein